MTLCRTILDEKKNGYHFYFNCGNYLKSLMLTWMVTLLNKSISIWNQIKLTISDREPIIIILMTRYFMMAKKYDENSRMWKWWKLLVDLWRWSMGLVATFLHFIIIKFSIFSYSDYEAIYFEYTHQTSND